MRFLFIPILSILQLYTVQSIAQASYEEAFEKQYEENIKLERINDVYIPIDIHDAFKQLDQISTPEGREKLIAGEEDVVADRLIFGLGKWIQLNWNLFEGSRFSHSLKQMGVSHPDDQARFTIISYYRYLKGDPLELESRAEKIFNQRKDDQSIDPHDNPDH